ncbi:MAG: hypothetical protein LQ346_006128 [Caloplaca aetnensis]|nr:MAG: hypothetical protein LQ346_006128 [Caloplaca aetnensis]
MPLIDNTHYNELPSLETAYTRRQAKHIDNLIQGPLRDVFIKYGAQKTFALYLQHRHHRLGRNDAIVKVHGTAHLMNEEDIVDIEAMGNKIIPATWMGKDMLAMEYAVAPTSYARHSFFLPQVATFNPLPATWLVTLTCVVLFPWDRANPAVIPPHFIAELDHVLTLSDCKGLFGIDTLAEDEWSELTVGNASVVVSSNGNEREEAYIPVAFAFDDRKPGFRVHGKCGKDHKHTSKPSRSGDV